MKGLYKKLNFYFLYRPFVWGGGGLVARWHKFVAANCDVRREFHHRAANCEIRLDGEFHAGGVGVVGGKAAAKTCEFVPRFGFEDV